MPLTPAPQELRFAFTDRAPLLRRVSGATLGDIARLSRLMNRPPVGIAITFDDPAKPVQQRPAPDRT